MLPASPLIQQYLNYLITIKGRSHHTIQEYRTDLQLFFRFVAMTRQENNEDLAFVDVN